MTRFISERLNGFTVKGTYEENDTEKIWSVTVEDEYGTTLAMLVTDDYATILDFCSMKARDY